MIRRLFLAFSLVAALVAVLAPPVQAQTQAGAPATVDSTQRAEEVRTQFMAVMKRYPPELGRILKLDPGLFHNEAYMAPYPALKTFVAQHPEIPRNPSVLPRELLQRLLLLPLARLGDVREPGHRRVRVRRDDGRPGWFRLVRADAHRLPPLAAAVEGPGRDAHEALDRFTANDELLAYVQSAAGSKFLQSAPITLDSGPAPARSARHSGGSCCQRRPAWCWRPRGWVCTM